MSHIACGHISAWALTAFLGSEFIWAVGYLELILLLKHTSSLRVVPTISAPHLPSLSISLPFIFKQHLPAFVWTFFFQQANPHHYPKRETYKLRARYDQTYLCLPVCPQTSGRPILKPPGKWTTHYLDMRGNGLVGEGRGTWVWDLDLDLDHSSGPHYATLSKAHNFLDSVSQTQSEEY